MRSALLKNTGRIVVKLGTGILTDFRNQPDLDLMTQLIGQIAALQNSGKQLVLVSSGAVGAGMGVLGYQKRPSDLAELQACAAVGQSRLMATYEQLFLKFSLHVAQVLLTHDDLQHHERHLNARNTLVTLLDHQVVPIINENDAVSFTELKFGDNDKLSALLTCLLPADLLITLTTVEGVLANFGKPTEKIVHTIEKIDAAVERLAGGAERETSTGGMISKIQAAKIVTRSGIPMIIASGKRARVLDQIMAGEEIGTLFIAQPQRLKGRKRWIAFFHHPKGALYVDDGAKVALREKGKSLLPPGVTRCEGDFPAASVVRICDSNGTEFARGICDFDSASIQTGQLPRTELVHRDNMVIL